MNLLLMSKPIYANLLYTACVQLKEVKMLSGVESWGMILLEKQEESEAAPKTKKGKVVKKKKKEKKRQMEEDKLFLFSLYQHISQVLLHLSLHHLILPLPLSIAICDPDMHHRRPASCVWASSVPCLQLFISTLHVSWCVRSCHV